MATANPPVRYREDDNYEIELSRVREKIRTQFGDLTDRLKSRERELLEELDAILASYRSYRDEVEIVRDKVRDLEMMKQRNEEGLSTSCSKKFQENIIERIDEEIKSITYPKQPQLDNFVCESNVIFSEIDKLGELVEEVTGRAESLKGFEELDAQFSTPPNSPSNIRKSFYIRDTREFFTNILLSSSTTHSSSKSLPQPITPYSYQSNNILTDMTANDLSNILSRTEINNSKNLKPSDTIHFTDSVTTGVCHEFSTYSDHGFYLDGEGWTSVQHYFHAQKYSSAKWVKNDSKSAVTFKEAKQIGKDNVNTNNIMRNWDTIRELVMFKALKAKFRDRSLKNTLLATGDRLIVNDSEDEFWGSGKDGKGKNTLGMLLMIVRSECLNPDVSKSSLQPNNTITSLHQSSLKTIPSNDDVIEFFDIGKPCFEFSPSSRHSVMLDNVQWKTLNHYLQAQGFTLNIEKREITDPPTPVGATYISNNELRMIFKTQNFDEKEKIMERGLEAKFTQHPSLKRLLLATGTRKLIYIHPVDMFWGTGTTKSGGQNKLGELLMNLRSKLSSTIGTNILSHIYDMDGRKMLRPRYKYKKNVRGSHA